MASADDASQTPRPPQGGGPKKHGLNYPRAGKGPVARWWPSLRLFGLIAALGLVAVALIFAVAYVTTPIPDPDDAAQAQATKVLYADGVTELGEFASIDRESIPLSEVAPTVAQAVVASEDRTFYENRGIDPRGIARALWNNIRGNETQGGSTLTQQYVERYFLGTTTDVFGKIREAIIALKIDRQESKDQILENYLNTIYFGRGAYGIERAAQVYFGKPASELTLAESAMLAGIIPAPSAWDPAVNYERAVERWLRVLDRMVEDGYISEEERDAQVFPETVAFERPNTYGGTEGYLLDTVRTELIERGGFTEAQLDQGGLTIVTTIDEGMQQAAIDAVDSLPDSKPENMHVALVSIDPATGAIKALYGGEDFIERSRNNATQDRAQGGSTFKPFTLIAALENGFTLEDRFQSYTPMEVEGFDRPVRNFDTVNRGTIDLVRATENSVNTVYAQLNVEVGPEKTVDVAVRAGLPEDTAGLEPFPSNVLGPASPHPADMATAYATFAAQGERHERFIVDSVRNPNGNVLYTGEQEGEQVFDQRVIADATYAMQAVVEGGTGRTASALPRPAAGKTGSSQDYRSAWFCGFVPQLATAVAMYQIGEDGSEETLTPFGGVNPIAGGTYPTTVWTRYMREATEGMEVLDFPERSRPTRAPSVPTATPTPTPTAEPTEEPTEEAMVEVPDVAGQGQAQAIATIAAAGLVPNTSTQASDAPAGTVIGTDPGAGAEVEPGSTVTILVSSGPAGPPEDGPGELPVPELPPELTG